MIEVTVVSGSSASSAKKAEFTSSAARAPMPDPRSMSKLMAEPPMIVNQTKNTRLGMPMTPATNCRIVRPFEILARKTPTNAPQQPPRHHEVGPPLHPGHIIGRGRGEERDLEEVAQVLPDRAEEEVRDEVGGSFEEQVRRVK